MRIIKLGPADDEMQSRADVIAYFTATLLQGRRYGRFGITRAKRNMPDITAGTTLVFTFGARCMFVARARGPVSHHGGYLHIPINMATVERVNVPLHNLERFYKKATGRSKSLVNTRQWPSLPGSLTKGVLRFLREKTLIIDQADPLYAEEQLSAYLFALFPEAGSRAGYWGRYYLRSLGRNGALATARRMLLPKRDGKVDKGLQRLIDAGLANELSVEAIVLRPEVAGLFSAEELAEARQRLATLPGQERQFVAPDDNFPDTLPKGKKYPEGALKTVVVNRYERNPKAREECIKHHGCLCSICRIDFGETYGEIGIDFIHVHHLRELATIRKGYEVDPIKDLIPVCPNCHAMIHSTRPARPLAEVRSAYLKRSNRREHR